MDFLKNFTDRYKIEKIPSSEIDQLVKDGAFILDVRTKQEYSGKSIKGSTNIPLDELKVRYVELPDEKIYVLCRSGARSLTAARFLKTKGFEVCNIDGGIQSYFASK